MTSLEVFTNHAMQFSVTNYTKRRPGNTPSISTVDARTTHDIAREQWSIEPLPSSNPKNTALYAAYIASLPGAQRVVTEFRARPLDAVPFYDEATFGDFWDLGEAFANTTHAAFDRIEATGPQPNRVMQLVIGAAACYMYETLQAIDKR